MWDKSLGQFSSNKICRALDKRFFSTANATERATWTEIQFNSSHAPAIFERRFDAAKTHSLDTARYKVIRHWIVNHFQILQAIELDNGDPRLVVSIKLDLGTANPRGHDCTRWLFPSALWGHLLIEGEEEKRYVSCTASTTFSRALLTSALISNKQQEAGDAWRCSFFANCACYQSTTAFVSRAILLNVSIVIIPYIDNVWSEIGKEKQCVILLDGHQGHFGELLKAFCG